MEFRSDLGAGPDPGPPARTVPPSDHRTQLGLDRRHQREDPRRYRDAGQLLDAGEPRGLPGQGEGQMDPSRGPLSRLEYRWHSDDGGGFRGAGGRAPAALPTAG